MPDANGKSPRYVWGAKAIGEAIGVTPRQAFYMLESGLLPGKKVGDRWVSDLNKIDDVLAGEDTDAA